MGLSQPTARWLRCGKKISVSLDLNYDIRDRRCLATTTAGQSDNTFFKFETILREWSSWSCCPLAMCQTYSDHKPRAFARPDGQAQMKHLLPAPAASPFGMSSILMGFEEVTQAPHPAHEHDRCEVSYRLRMFEKPHNRAVLHGSASTNSSRNTQGAQNSAF
jgi:hypothetical protein